MKCLECPSERSRSVGNTSEARKSAIFKDFTSFAVHLDFNYRKYRITKENKFDIAYLFVPQGQKIYDGKR